MLVYKERKERERQAEKKSKQIYKKKNDNAINI